MTEEGFVHARAGQVVQILRRKQERIVRTKPGWPPQQGPVGKRRKTGRREEREEMGVGKLAGSKT